MIVGAAVSIRVDVAVDVLVAVAVGVAHGPSTYCWLSVVGALLNIPTLPGELLAFECP